MPIAPYYCKRNASTEFDFNFDVFFYCSRLIGSIAWLLVTYAQYRTNVSYRLIFVMLVIMNANLMASLWTISYGQGVFLVNQIVSWICFSKSLVIDMKAELQTFSFIYSVQSNPSYDVFS